MRVSSLRNSGPGTPSASASRGAGTSGVMPGARSPGAGAGRQEWRVAPDRTRTGLDGGPAQVPGEHLGVVLGVEGAEAARTGVLQGGGVGGLAAAAAQDDVVVGLVGHGRRPPGSAWGDVAPRWVNRSAHLPSPRWRGRKWHLPRPEEVAGASSGRSLRPSGCVAWTTYEVVVCQLALARCLAATPEGDRWWDGWQRSGLGPGEPMNDLRHLGVVRQPDLPSQPVRAAGQAACGQGAARAERLGLPADPRRGRHRWRDRPQPPPQPLTSGPGWWTRSSSSTPAPGTTPWPSPGRRGQGLFEHEVLPGEGPGSGKGEALWKSQHACEGDLICWVDADIRNSTPASSTGCSARCCSTRTSST